MAQTIKAGPEVDVPELKEFLRSLRKLGGTYMDELKDLNEEAADLVVDRAQSTTGLRPHQRNAARDLRSRRRQSGAVIALAAAGKSKEYALGAEFGAKAHPQFEPWRGNQWVEWGNSGVGYFLHPAVRESTDDVFELYGDRLLELAEKIAKFN